VCIVQQLELKNTSWLELCLENTGYQNSKQFENYCFYTEIRHRNSTHDRYSWIAPICKYIICIANTTEYGIIAWESSYRLICKYMSKRSVHVTIWYCIVIFNRFASLCLNVLYMLYFQYVPIQRACAQRAGQVNTGNTGNKRLKHSLFDTYTRTSWRAINMTWDTAHTRTSWRAINDMWHSITQTGIETASLDWRTHHLGMCERHGEQPVWVSKLWAMTLCLYSRVAILFFVCVKVVTQKRNIQLLKFSQSSKLNVYSFNRAHRRLTNEFINLFQDDRCDRESKVCLCVGVKLTEDRDTSQWWPQWHAHSRLFFAWLHTTVWRRTVKISKSIVASRNIYYTLSIEICILHSTMPE